MDLRPTNKLNELAFSYMVSLGPSTTYIIAYTYSFELYIARRTYVYTCNHVTLYVLPVDKVVFHSGIRNEGG